MAVRRRTAKTLLDILAWGAAVHLAFLLRLEEPVTEWWTAALALSVLAAPLVYYFEYAVGLVRQSWAHVGVNDLVRLAMATGLTTLALFLLVSVVQALRPDIPIPRSVPLIAGILAFLATGMGRLTVRVAHERRTLPGGRGGTALIVGADRSAVLGARAFQGDGGNRRRIVGFVDDSPWRQGVSYLGIPVLGPTSRLMEMASRHKVDEVLVALPAASETAKAVRRACQKAGLPCRPLPSLTEILDARLHRRAAGVDVEDLLGRPRISLDLPAIRSLLADRTVLVTGAGGSIGSEIVRQVCAFEPKRVVLLSIEENSLFELDHELRAAGVKAPRSLVVASVRDRDRLERVFRAFAPDVVFHAAAHKHVPLMEDNPDEAVLNNVEGTRNVAELCLKAGVRRFVNISTDKAVRPTNVMGATKRVAEMVVTGLSRGCAPDQHMVSVRFGNVLGSRGSVIPLWLRQIESGGPLTVTHPDMRRYFMLIPEAVQLVLQAAEFGGQGTVYVLDMGEPVRIGTVAEDFIRMHGLRPGTDIEIVVTGIRPGEKMTEELLVGGGRQEPSRHPKIFLEPVAQPEGFERSLARLVEAARSGDPAGVRSGLAELVGEPALQARTA